jgi:V-type H+-transporting ATPase proteolipid subunit
LTQLNYYGVLFFSGFVHLGAGMICGLTCLAAGLAIGIVGDAGIRGYIQQPSKTIKICMILVLIFAETLGLYGFITALYMINKLN